MDYVSRFEAVLAECSPLFLAKVRAILLRPAIQEEVLVYIRSVVDRKATLDREAGDDWLANVRIWIDPERQENPLGPEYPRLLPAIRLELMNPDGQLMQGMIRLRTEE